MSPAALKDGAVFTILGQRGALRAPAASGAAAAPSFAAHAGRAPSGLAAAADPSDNAAAASSYEPLSPAPTKGKQLKVAAWGQWVSSLWWLSGVPFHALAGYELLTGTFTGAFLPAWQWAAYPLFAYAAFEAAAGFAYGLLGWRIFRAMRAGGVKFKQAVFDPIATPEADAPAYANLPEHARRQVDAHENAHRRGRGEMRAHLAQIPGQPRFLFGELKRLLGLPARLWTKVFKLDLGRAELGPKVKRFAWVSIITSLLLVAGATLAMAHATLAGDLLNFVSGEDVSAWSQAALDWAQGLGLTASPIWLLTGMIGVSIAAYVVIDAVQRLLRNLAAYRMSDVYRRFLFRHGFSLKALDHADDKFGANKLADRVMEDAENLTNKNFAVPIAWAEYAFYLLLAGAGIALVHPWFGLALAAYIPFAVVFNLRLGKRWEELLAQQREMSLEAKNMSQSVFDRIPKMVTSGTRAFEVERLDKIGRELQAVEDRNVRLGGYTEVVARGSDFFAEFLVYIIGGVMIVAAFGLNYGQIIQLAMYTGFLYYGVNGLLENYVHVREARGQTRGVRALIARAPEDADGDAFPAGVPMSVQFKDVRYAYPDGTEVLRGVDFDVAPGELVALMGPSGGGKSTAAELVTKILELSGFGLTLDGRDVRDLSAEAVRARIAYAQQQPVLMSRSFRDNLAAWAEREASDAEMAAALRAAGADFILRRRGDLDGVVGPDNNLSGGEAKRFMLAGALLRRGDLTVLDEPTRGLDPQTRRRVAAAIAAAPGSKLIVTHDPLLAARADKVVVLAEGRVAEMGSPERLRAAGGWFAEHARGARADAGLAAPAAEDAAADDEDAATSTAPAPAKKSMRRDLWSFLVGDEMVRPLLKKYYRPLLLGIGFAFVVSLITAGNGYVLGMLLDRALETAGGGMAAAWPLIYIGLGAVAAHLAAMYLRMRTWVLIGYPENGFRADLRAWIYDRLLAKDYRFYMRTSPRRLAAWLDTGVESLIEKNISVRVPLIDNIILILVTGTFMVLTNPILGGVGMAVLVAVGWINLKLGEKSETLYEEYTERSTGLWGKVKEVYDSIRHHKRLNRRRAESARFDESSRDLRDVGLRAGRIEAGAGVVSSELTEIATHWLVLLAGAFAVAGLLGIDITLGQIVAMTMFAEFFNKGFQEFWGNWIGYKQSQGSANRVVAWLEDTSLDKPDEAGLPEMPDLADADLAVSGLSYRYSEDGPRVLKDIDLEIAAGETVMLVGPSGSGKSTLLWNMLGLLKPAAGRVGVAGYDLARVREDSFIRQVGVVDQDPSLFPGSLRYNLTYGLGREAADEEIYAAAEAAGAGFVRVRGLDAPLGPHDLSGGEMQRVSIARALLRRPKVLFLDEPASQLDPDLVDSFWQVVENLKAGHPRFGRPTIVIVTHNIRRVARFADRAVVLERGRLVENGAPAELLRAGGRFADLHGA